jgi:hypothetical protein
MVLGGDNDQTPPIRGLLPEAVIGTKARSAIYWREHADEVIE